MTNHLGEFASVAVPAFARPTKRLAVLIGGCAMAVMLSGCDANSVVDATKAGCKYAPAIGAVEVIAGIFFPGFSGFLTASQVTTVSKTICEAVETSKSTKGFVASRSIKAHIVDAAGHRRAIALGGEFVK